MQDTKKPEKYGIVQPVLDVVADDPDALAATREATILRWRTVIDAYGYRIIAEPVITEDINISYGHPLYDTDGEPILGDDGEQLTEHTKQYVSVHGWVVRP